MFDLKVKVRVGVGAR